MGEVLTAEQVRRLRLRAQGLAAGGGPAPGDAAQVVGRLVGVQAQEAEAAALAVGVRQGNVTAAQIEAARLEERSIVRTWALRGTLHLVAAADLGWLLPLVAPGVIRQRRRRYDELGLSEERYGRAAALMAAALRDRGAMTRGELGGYLAERGAVLEGQALYHALGRAGLEGLLCFGPDREGEETYVLLDEWASTGPAMEEEEALLALTRRYLRGYGPAGPEDLAAWSGLGLRKIRAAIEDLSDELLALEVGGAGFWMLKGQGDWLQEAPDHEPVLRLLPAYDPYLLGYRSRELMVSEQHARRIHPGGGFLRPAAIVDGRAVGTWRLKWKKGRVEINVEPFAAPDDRVMEALEHEVEGLGRFYGAEAVLAAARPREKDS